MRAPAAPRATFAAIDPGTPVALEGMRADGAALALVVPPPPVAFTMRVGDRIERVLPALDAIEIHAEAAEARIVWRARLSYDLVRFEKRELRAEMAR
jgi:hypothetical protein